MSNLKILFLYLFPLYSLSVAAELNAQQHSDSENSRVLTTVESAGSRQAESIDVNRRALNATAGMCIVPDPEPTRPDTTNGAFCARSVSSTDSFVVPSMAKPDVMVPYNDPVFGGRVTRITNSAFGEVNKPVYSTMQAWNADESYLLLYRTGVPDNGHMLHDGHTYEFIKSLDFTPADLEQAYWSRTDPDSLYYVSKRAADYGKFNRFSVRTNRATEIADFSAYCGASLPNAGNDVQMHAATDDLFGFRCRQDDGRYIMFSYKPSTGEVVTAPIGAGSLWQNANAPMPSASGDSFWLQGMAIEPDLATIRYELDLAQAAEHSSMGITHNGQDAYYQVSFGPSPGGCDGDLYEGVGQLVEHNLETGKCRNIISQEKGYPYTTSSTHVSALAYLKPSRVAVSSIGNRSQTSLLSNGAAAPALFSEIYVAQTDPSDTVVCRYAHHRSFGKSGTKGGFDPYFGEPHATISPSGTRVIFGSDWHNSGSVDSYVLELPDYDRP